MGQTILLVEDSEDDIFIFDRVIKKAGITGHVEVVRDGQEALDYLSGNGRFADRQKFPLPTLALVDLKLPRISGLEILQWIREQPHLETLSVVVLTSSSEDRDVIRAYQLGARSYLVKPPTTTALLAVVKAVGASALSARERLWIAGERSI